MKYAALILAMLLAACGGGDPELETEEMPCKYRPDCSVGPPLSFDDVLEYSPPVYGAC